MLPTATSIKMPREAVSTRVGIPTPQTMLGRALGRVGSNQDCLSTLRWREREMILCKRRGRGTRGKGCPELRVPIAHTWAAVLEEARRDGRGEVGA